MNRSLAVLIVTLVATVANAEPDGHLLPIRPNFDAFPGVPDAREFAKACEEKLFDRSGWVIRYFEVVENPSATTGLSVCRTNSGSYSLVIRQARPDISALANYTSALKSVRVKKLDCEMPSSTAESLIKVWNIFLSQTRAERVDPGVIEIRAPEIILYAKGADEHILAGKFPPNANENSSFVRLSQLVSHLLDTYDKPKADRRIWLDEIRVESENILRSAR